MTKALKLSRSTRYNIFLMPAQKAHACILFVHEKHVPTMQDSISGDKAYLVMRQGAKMLAGALVLLCSRKRIQL
jgi:hypothetical protein